MKLRIILSILLSLNIVSGAVANTLSLRGMNWACGANNYVTIPWPDGLIGNESPAQAYAKGVLAGNAVMSQGGNTLRLPIEPPMATGANWALYTNVVNGLLATGSKVMFCYWTADSYVTNQTEWYAMWDTVNATYAGATNVLYEPINEPASQSNLNDLYAAFIARYRTANNKCVLDGAGYAQNVTSLGGDARLDGQLLALHFYEWYDNATNSAQSYNDTAAGVGPYAYRTVITETGAPTDGEAVPTYWQQYGYNLNAYVSSISGCLSWARDNSVGTIQWSGINSQDFFHWSRGLANLTVARPDLAQMFQWAWGLYGPPAGQINLFSDSFYSATGTWELNGTPSQRQTGLLSPMAWTPDNNWYVQLGDPGPTNLLLTLGASAYLATDFAPTVNSLNLPLAVSFQGSVANDAGDPTTWFSLNVNTAPTGWGPSSATYSILFRENGGSQIFNNGIGNILGAPNWGPGATNQYIAITAVFSDVNGTGSPFKGNGTVVTVYANGVAFTTNHLTTPLTSGYLGFSCNGGYPPIYYIAGLQVGTVVPRVAPYFAITPQSVTNWAGVPAALPEAVVGSQPISFQWFSNNVALSGQTNATLRVVDPEITAAYVLQAANVYGRTSSPPITLTVQNPAQSDQMLFTLNDIAIGLSDAPPANDYIGEFFTTGAKSRTVTHLGYYDATGTGTTASHHVGIFANGSLVASVDVTPGTNLFAANNFRWVPLSRPLTLLPDTTYVIFGDNNTADYWPNNVVPNWNPAYLGTNFIEHYLSWNWDAAPPFAWADYPNSATMVGDQGWNDAHAFGSVNLGNFPMTMSRVGFTQQITWTLGTLTSSTNVAGPYSPVPGAVSPYALPPTRPAMFYRVRY